MDMKAADKPDDVVEPQTAAVSVDLRHISVEQFAQLGMTRIAYVKAVEVDGKKGFAIHAANGAPMALTPELDVALAVIMQNEMEPALVH